MLVLALCLLGGAVFWGMMSRDKRPLHDPERYLLPGEYNWRKAPDLRAIQRAIARQTEQFQDAMNSRDIPRATALITAEVRGAYGELFSRNPDAMPSFGALFDRAQINFLSAPVNPEAELTRRTAEYAIVLDGFTFYVRWAQVGDEWLLMDF